MTALVITSLYRSIQGRRGGVGIMFLTYKSFFCIVLREELSLTPVRARVYNFQNVQLLVQYVHH